MIRLKPGVSLDNVHPRVFHLISVAARIWSRHESPDLWITGGNESGHASGARGYHRLADGACQAVDLRTWSIPGPLERRKAAVEELAWELGPDFDTIFEEELRDPVTSAILKGEHAHCQYDPGRPGTVV